jgi:RluA family pseudouridine synthase
VRVVRKVRISADDADQRLDRFLRKYLPSATLGHVFKLVRKGRVRVNGRKAKPAYRLAEGDEVELRLGDERLGELDRPRGTSRSPLVTRDAPAITFLPRDEHVLAVDKPAMVLVQPGERGDEPTLQDLVRARLEPVDSLTFRPSLAHRLDRGTSGIVLFGLTARGLRGLVRRFREKEVRKRYLALVVGEPDDVEFTVDLSLERDPSDDLRGARVKTSRGPRAKEALTEFRVLAGPSDRGLTLVEARPRTGRTHQIRVHLRAARLPIVGDPTYGVPERNRDWRKVPGIWRQFLYAWRIELEHPVEAGARLSVESPLPEDLVRTLRWAGLGTALEGL